MKKSIRLLAAVLLVLLLGGCTAENVTVNSLERVGAHRCSMQYDRFDGTKEYDLHITEEEAPVTIEVAVVTESGDLSLCIEKADGVDASAYTGQELATAQFGVTLEDAGDYVIRVTAHHHSGSYSFDWGN